MAPLRQGFIILFIALVEDSSEVLRISFNGKDSSGLPEGEPYKLIEGHDLLLDCSSSYPNSSFIWTKDGNYSSFNQEKKVLCAQVGDGGIYNCQATSFDQTGSSARVENKSISVEILYPPSYPKVEPVFIDGPYYALHGEAVTLTCKSDANPKSNYKWRSDIETGPLLTRNANYHLMVEPYKKYYCCTVNNQMVPTIGEAVTTSITRYLQIRVYIKAYIYEIEGGIYRNINEGDPVTVNCMAYGRPPPRIWWTKAGDDNFLLDSNQLSQMHASQKFAGKYFCNVKNTVIASNGSRITTQSKQEVYITVLSNLQTENEWDSKNTALFILTGIGWLGFVSSMLVHISIFRKNKIKKMDTASMTGCIATTEGTEPYYASSTYTNNVRIPRSSSVSTLYDEIDSENSITESSTNSDSNLIVLSTRSLCYSTSTNDGTYLHAQS